MATPSDYRNVNVAGGFVPNVRGSIFFNETMDIVDNPNIIEELKGIRNYTETSRSYIHPPPLKTGLDKLPKLCSPSETGFTRTRASHAANTMQIFDAHRARTLMHNSAQLGGDCKVPGFMSRSETHEEFSNRVPPPCPYPHWNDFHPGSNETGYTQSMKHNPLDGRVMDPIWLGATPDFGRMGPSMTHGDYLPSRLKNGKEFTLPLSMTGRTITGFNRFQELHPCYSDHSWKGPCRNEDFITSYNNDYYKKSSYCDTVGKQIIGKGFNIAGNMGDVNLFVGPGYYISEAMERYVSPVLEGRARHGHLRGAVETLNQTSGFVHGTKVHNTFTDPCRRGGRMSDRLSDGPLDPGRYNPWPRFFVGHKGMLNKNYRPHPVSEAGTDYDIRNVIAGTDGGIYKEVPALS